MNKFTSLSLAAAVLGAAALATLSTPAQAYPVKCFGIAKAGENDCANAAGTHGCKGQAAADYDGGDWKGVVSRHACNEMGGQLEPFEGMNPAKES